MVGYSVARSVAMKVDQRDRSMAATMVDLMAAHSADHLGVCWVDSMAVWRAVPMARSSAGSWAVLRVALRVQCLVAWWVASLADYLAVCLVEHLVGLKVE